MKTEAEVRKFLESNPTATIDDVRSWIEATSAEQDEPRNRFRGLLNAARTAAQGATFGLSDEIIGSIRGALDPNMTMAEGRQAEREAVEEFREDHPLLATGLEFAGGFATGAGVGRVAAKGAAKVAPRFASAVSRAPRWARVGGGATAAGAAAGAGAAEGGVEERLRGAAWGGAFGAGTAAGLGLAGAGLRAARGAVRQGLDVVGMAPTKTPENRFVRLALPASAEQRAEVIASRALERTGKTAEEILEEAQRNPEFMLADASRSTQRLARTVGTVPSKGSEDIAEALLARQEGQSARLGEALQKRTGLMRGDAPALIDDIADEQDEAARPLYKAAYEKHIKDPRILKVLNTPQFMAAYQRGRRIAALEGVDLPDVFKSVKKGKKTVRQLDTSKTVPVQAIDYMKRGMDDLIASRMRGGKMARQEARALRKKLNNVLEITDELVPDFELARGTWAGAEEAKRAAEFGAKFYNQTPAAIERRFAKMTEGEKMVARRAAVDQAMLRLEGTGDTHDATRKLAGNPQLRQRLRLLFDSDEQMDAFIRDVQDEARMGQTFNVVRGGSNTVDKSLDMADFMGIDLGDLVATGGRPLSLAQRLLSSRVGAAMQGVNERTANELAPILTARGEELARRLRRLQEVQRQQAEAAARRVGAVRGGATVAGLSAGRVQ